MSEVAKAPATGAFSKYVIIRVQYFRALNAHSFYDASFKQEQSLHCEKSLFVLASRQKIPALWTEIPAVDTRTICLLPIEFF